MSDTYSRLIALLNERGAGYRVIEHPPEGRTEIVSSMRGHPVVQAAKCMILITKLRKQTRYVLAVVPGNARIDLGAVKRVTGSTYVSFAAPQIAEELSGSVMGGVMPFSFDPRLELIVDPELLRQEELYTNAARLDRSIALRTHDYVRIANPRFEEIAGRGEAP